MSHRANYHDQFPREDIAASISGTDWVAPVDSGDRPEAIWFGFPRIDWDRNEMPPLEHFDWSRANAEGVDLLKARVRAKTDEERAQLPEPWSGPVTFGQISHQPDCPCASHALTESFLVFPDGVIVLFRTINLQPNAGAN